MRRYAAVTMVCFVAIIIGLSCQQSKKENVLVEVGSEVIAEPDLELLAKVNPRLKRRLATAEGRKQVLDNYVEQSLMYQEAVRQGYADDPLMEAKIDLYRKVILAQGLLDKKLEEASRQYYEDHRDEFEKIKLAHIYIPFKTEKNLAISKDQKVTRSEEQAKKLSDKVLKELKQDPDSLVKLVEKYSEDERTKKTGGDLGWVTLNDARLRRWGWASLAEKTFPMRQGTIVDPIKTENGYHVVKVMAGKKMDQFDEVSTRIRFKIQAQTKANFVDELKKRYTVSFADAKAEAPAEVQVPSEAVESEPQAEEPAEAAKPAE